MTITQLEGAISALAAQMGYQALTTNQQMLEKQLANSKIAWLKPLELLEREGRHTGRDRYQLELSFIADNSLYTNYILSRVLGGLQTDMLALLTNLSIYEGVVEIANINIKPSTVPLTSHSDISQTCTAEIVCYF